jgi:uncharacterized protein YhfF
MEKPLDRAAEFWAQCKASLPGEPLGEKYTVRRIGNNAQICRLLLDLITSGEKTGTFSLPRELEEIGLTPHPGDYVILVDFESQPACLIRMDVCELVAFQDIRLSHVACEGPGARDVEVWRAIHRDYWSSLLAGWGEDFRDDLPVLFQRFTLLRAAGDGHIC